MALTSSLVCNSSENSVKDLHAWQTRSKQMHILKPQCHARRGRAFEKRPGLKECPNILYEIRYVMSSFVQAEFISFVCMR